MRILVCTLAVAIVSVGCAKAGDSTHKELAAIQQELVRMRAENAILMARLEALETTRSRQTTSETTPKPTVASDDDRPKLDVLRLAPTSDPAPATATDKPRVAMQDEATQPGEVEQDEPRPVIRSTGRGEVVAQSPRTPKSPSPPSPSRPTTTGSGTPR
jgi:hypothetical protein